MSNNEIVEYKINPFFSVIFSLAAHFGWGVVSSAITRAQRWKIITTRVGKVADQWPSFEYEVGERLGNIMPENKMDKFNKYAASANLLIDWGAPTYLSDLTMYETHLGKVKAASLIATSEAKRLGVKMTRLHVD